MIYLVTLSPAIDRYIYTEQFNYHGRSNVENIKSTFGGKAINVAKIVTQFTKDYELITLTDNEHNKFIHDELSEINHHLLMSEQVRINHKLNVNGELSELNQRPFALSCNTKEEIGNYLLNKVSDKDYVLFAGSVNQQDISFLIELCNRLNTNKIALDVPTLTIEELKQIKPFVIKPNEDEIKDLVGDEHADLDKACEILLNCGVQNVIISLGAEGSYFKNENCTYRISPIRGKVKNTVGAGDSFIGGFLSSYALEENFKKALMYGAASGSASAFSEFIADKEFIECIYSSVEID